MPTHILSLDAIRLGFGGDPLLANAGLIVGPRARIAVVGRNGSGKSTLLKIAAGIIAPDQGERYVDPKCALAYLDQEPDLSGYASLRDYVDAGRPAAADEGLVARIAADLDVRLDASPDSASGGERRRAALARAFAAAPDLILLDEPTNHLDLGAIDWLERHIRAFRGAIVMISHDRRLLEATTDETLWIDRGRTLQIDKGFRDFEAWRDDYLEQEARDAHKLDRKIAAEEDWVRYGVTARRKRNVRRMAELAELRQSRRAARKAVGQVNFSVAENAASSARVIRARNISKSFGDRTVVRDFSVEIVRGDRVALVGPNGAGKTTLLKMLTGALQPDEGETVIGESVDLVALDQNRADLDPSMRVADAITDGRGDWVTFGEEKKHVASYLKDFLFAPAQFRSPVSALSGGERGRLALAAILAKPSNLLVLDEPTNDLDLETLDLLEETLADYAGTLLLVSHDRSFIDRVATAVIAPTPDGEEGSWTEYVGGYSDMVAQRGRPPVGAAARKAADVGAPGKPAPTADRTGGSRAKLSYKEKYALEQLPGRIADLEARIAGLKADLGAPGLFAKDAAAFNRKAAELADAERSLADAEEEWLSLEMKREAIEG
ncbi:MAG: ATP-binding cassette domain-containing protein [Alphaproteobacteria bacterium]|nr:ATP-binding cassette domain-containing protein [Alphaproteobacteria bacterium]